MTNLKIGIPDIPFNATRITASNTTDDYANLYNLRGGKRSQYVKLSSAASSCSYTFDLGNNYTSRNSQVDYLAIGRADLLGANTVLVESSPDNATWTTRMNITSFTSTARYGPRSEDYINTITLTSAIRYWKITYSMSAGTNTFTHSKIGLGQLFNFSSDPNFKFYVEQAKNIYRYAKSGAAEFLRSTTPVYTFEFEWFGQSDSVIKDFSNKLVRYADKLPVWLYTSAEHQILDSQRLVYAYLTHYESVRDYAGFNTIRATFVESIG